MGLAMPFAGAAVLEACGAGSTSSSGGTSTGKQNFQGVTLQVASGITAGEVAKAAAKVWNQKTGGTAVVNEIPFSDRAVKYAGYIATQDSSVDVVYAYSGYIGQFGDRLYEDISHLAGDTSDFVQATLQTLSANGKLLALPIHSEMEIFIYNKQYFKDAGTDPNNIPGTWNELFQLSDKLRSGNRYPCAVPWDEGEVGFWLVFFNSTGGKFLSADRTRQLFDNANGLAAFQTVEAGFQAKFFDPTVYFGTSDYDTGIVFNEGNTASQINFSELWGQAVSQDVAKFHATLDPANVGARTIPGIKAGTSGSVNGFEGFGVSKFSRQKEAALSFVQECASAEVQKPLTLSRTLPSAHISILEDPEVKNAFSVGPVLAKQGTYNLDRYGAPYDVSPVFSDVITRMFKGQITAQQAHQQAVQGVNGVIEKWLQA
jgi:multiple sugar transport system substrate-binding protein